VCQPFQRAIQHLHPSEKFVFTARDDARALRRLHKMLVSAFSLVLRLLRTEIDGQILFEIDVAKQHSHSHTELNVTIIGMPNVGKSTLLNGLRGVGIPGGARVSALRLVALTNLCMCSPAQGIANFGPSRHDSRIIDQAETLPGEHY